MSQQAARGIANDGTHESGYELLARYVVAACHPLTLASLPRTLTLIAHLPISPSNTIHLCSWYALYGDSFLDMDRILHARSHFCDDASTVGVRTSLA